MPGGAGRGGAGGGAVPCASDDSGSKSAPVDRLRQFREPGWLSLTSSHILVGGDNYKGKVMSERERERRNRDEGLGLEAEKRGREEALETDRRRKRGRPRAGRKK